MNLGSRRVRLKAIWLLLIPFLILARPTPRLLVGGGILALLGAGIRAWAAGCIRKDRELATTGPYAHTRNPLYLGSLLIGTGVTLAGGRWIFVVLFLLFFLVVYRRTILDEKKGLEEEFGDTYRRYREAVPALLPRFTPYVDRGMQGESGGSGVPGSGVPGGEAVASAASSGDGSWSVEESGRSVGGSATTAEAGSAATEEAREVDAADTGVLPWEFSVRQYLRNREWEAALGVAAGFAFLAIKMIWP